MNNTLRLILVCASLFCSLTSTAQETATTSVIREVRNFVPAGPLAGRLGTFFIKPIGCFFEMTPLQTGGIELTLRSRHVLFALEGRPYEFVTLKLLPTDLILGTPHSDQNDLNFRRQDSVHKEISQEFSIKKNPDSKGYIVSISDYYEKQRVRTHTCVIKSNKL